MSVPVHERKIGELSFLTNAEKLQHKTADIVMNTNYVGKKWRFVWTSEVFKLSMNIFENVRRANIIYPNNEELLRRRISFLRNAESDAEALLSQVSFSRKHLNIPP